MVPPAGPANPLPFRAENLSGHTHTFTGGRVVDLAGGYPFCSMDQKLGCQALFVKKAQRAAASRHPIAHGFGLQ